MALVSLSRVSNDARSSGGSAFGFSGSCAMSFFEGCALGAAAAGALASALVAGASALAAGLAAGAGAEGAVGSIAAAGGCAATVGGCAATVGGGGDGGLDGVTEDGGAAFADSACVAVGGDVPGGAVFTPPQPASTITSTTAPM